MEFFKNFNRQLTPSSSFFFSFSSFSIAKLFVFVFFFFRKFSVFGWDEFLRQLSIFLLFNRSNSDVMSRTTRRLSKSLFVSHQNLTSSEIDSTRKIPQLKSEFDSNTNEIFRKHGKILEKLHQHDEEKKKSPYDWSIVENLDENADELPKLKVDGRDQRQSVTNPWVMVKEMQHLRNEPILIKSTQFQIIRV